MHRGLLLLSLLLPLIAGGGGNDDGPTADTHVGMLRTDAERIAEAWG
jgi:hypothetical protein